MHFHQLAVTLGACARTFHEADHRVQVRRLVLPALELVRLEGRQHKADLDD